MYIASTDPLPCLFRFLKDEIDSYGGDSVTSGRLVVRKLLSICLRQQVGTGHALRRPIISTIFMRVLFSTACSYLHTTARVHASLPPSKAQDLSNHLFKWIDTDGNGFLEVCWLEGTAVNSVRLLACLRDLFFPISFPCPDACQAEEFLAPFVLYASGEYRTHLETSYL